MDDKVWGGVDRHSSAAKYCRIAVAIRAMLNRVTVHYGLLYYKDNSSRVSYHGVIHTTLAYLTPHAPPPMFFVFARYQRRAGGDSSSDSDTDGEETRDAPRLTPATMVDRSSSQVLRRPTPSQPIAAPPTKAQSKKSPRDLENEERERGNAKFGKGDFEGAVKSYTR